MKRSMKRLISFAAVLGLLAGTSATSWANPFVVDASGANLSVAQGCLVSESFCDPTDANYVDLVASALGTGGFSFSGLTPGAQTVTFNLAVPSASLDDGGAGNPTVDQIELTNLSVSGTVAVTVSNSFIPGLVDISLTSPPASVTIAGDIEILQGGGSLGSTPFSVGGVGLNSLTCNFFSAAGGLCGITTAPPGDLQINVGGQDIALESFAFNPTLALPEPTILALVGAAGLALMGYRRRA
jgi:hypothetical protein